MSIRGNVESKQQHPRLYQALALLFVVLYLLASVRGLVPGLCLNLRPFDAQASEACMEEDAGSCCSAKNRAAEGAPDSTPAAPKNCPFCRLVHGLTETLVYVHFEPLSAAPEHIAFSAPAGATPQEVEHSFSGRGPPAPCRVYA